MEFQKYSSLESAQKQKTVNAAVDAGHAKILYGVSEKIHGANFGIHYDAEATGPIAIQFSRRTGFLEEDETFYSHVKIEQTLLKRMTKLIGMMEALGEVSTISVYGEIHGGTLNGVTEQGCKKVQKEVQYSPRTQFAAFDLIIDGNYLPMVTMTNFLGACGFHLAPLIGIYESLEEALAVSNTFKSRVPALLGFEVEGDNFAEGTVIRPWGRDIYLPNGKHFILKNKSSAFFETKVAKVASVEADLTKFDQKLFSLISRNINETRFNAVVSKEKELTSKDFGRILGLFMKDAINDFDEDDDIPARNLADDWSRVNKELSKVAQVIVRNYWTTEL